MKKIKFRTFAIVFLIIISCPLIAKASEEPTDSLSTEVYSYLKDLYTIRNNAFLDGILYKLKPFYDTSQNYGAWSLDHEVRRVKYLVDWSNERGIKFTSIDSLINIKKITCTGDSLKVRTDEQYIFKYIYKEDSSPSTNEFGVNLYHTITLKKKNGSYVVYNDYYLDCFEDGLKSYSEKISDTPYEPSKDFSYAINIPCKDNKCTEERGKYNRVKAIEYADKYCGVPWGSNNPIKYNRKYKNFTGVGGNCTNYVSQCLGDSEGGGLKQGHGWHCIYKGYDGAETSTAWSNADAFKNFLLYSGKGVLVKKGTFKELVSSTEKFPQGPISMLDFGDVISYDKGNDIDHNAIVTSFDSHGYPLINSHTVDRYHVPFDLGWGDNNIKFLLIHIK